MFGAFQKTISELLSRRDWIYLLSLLVPLAVYNLALKAMSIVLKEDGLGLWDSLGLMRSDILFNAGYGILWIGVFAVARQGILRKAAVVLFHLISLLIVTVTTVAYQYFDATGSTLDWGVVVFYLATLGEIKDVILGTAPVYAWVVLVVALLYVIFGPRLAVRLLERRWPRPVAGDSPRTSPLGAAAGLCLIAVGIGSFSLFPGAANADRSFSLSPPINVLATGIGGPENGNFEAGASSRVVDSLNEAGLKETPQTRNRNVVLIFFESTPSRSTTPYNKDLKTTPFLDDLSKKSLMVERAYTTMPHTSKATTSVNCGIYPDPETAIHESEPGAVPVRCLPKLLGQQGYRSAWFQSATETFENRPQLVKNFGYDDFYGLEDMDKKGFQRASYLGYEDDIMLEPSRKWLEEKGKKGPFLATYLTITPHHEYLAPSKRYGRKDFAEEDIYNRYLNSVRYVDFFLKNLMDQYKQMGLYENTIFVVMGDHGEAFGEHGIKGHDGVPYDEGLRIPFLIHDPKRWQDGKRIEGPANQLDVAPTILDMLGYKVANGRYPGRSVLDPPEDQPLFFNCRPDLLCTSSIEDGKKYIYYYGKRPDEFYDLENDPLEKNDIAAEIPPSEIEQRRNDVLEWRSRAAAAFDKPSPKSE